MSRRIFTSALVMLLSLYGKYVTAQSPNLPTKTTLSQVLLSNKTFSQTAQIDTVVKQRPIANDFTLEIAATIHAATGRGLDIEARNSKLKGFRLSLDSALLKSTSPLANAKTLSAAKKDEEQLIRVAVKSDIAYIYQNGVFIQSQPLAAVKDIVDGVEVNTLLNVVKDSVNLMPNWAGTSTSTSGKPSDYGWTLLGTTANLFNTANGTSGSRYMDVTTTTNTHTYNNSPYTGRVLYIRWDNNDYKDAWYGYKVTLEANTTYDFSMLHAYVSNGQSSKAITVGIGKTNTVTGRYDKHVFYTSGTRVLNRENYLFTSQEAGDYYLTFTGDWGLYSIAELSFNKVNVQPRFIFGKNYPNGAVDMEVRSVTYEEGAYAPSEIVTHPKQDVTLTGQVVMAPTTFNTNFIVPGKTDLHLTGEVVPMINSTVALNSNDAWLFFDNVRPSEVIANWLDKVTINGASAANNPAVRIAIYKNGTVVIPNGNITSQGALEVFTDPNLGGDTRSFEIETYHKNLGTFDNQIQSFRLKRGYMATLATNPDGSGFSRVFIANDDDLIVNTLPQALDAKTSFIRVFKWEWVSKKGKAGGGTPLDLTQSTWYYDWNIGGQSTANYHYSIIRQNGGWPAWEALNEKQNVNHLLGFNEPDRPDQANMTVAEAIAQWPEMMKSGLRLGSPAPASPQNSWITDFMSKCNELNYRVDYVAIHCYWGGLTPQQWYSQLKSIYDRVKRPLWITEWNNGANWTTESWPADPQAQFQKQYNDMIGILNVLDTTSFIERYAIYDWVEDKRAMVLADTLTPAGKYYASNKSNFAFNPQLEYIHTWKLASPQIYSTIHEDNYFKTTLTWNDLNGELGSKYVLERKIEGINADFLAIQEFTNYVYGDTMSYVDDVRAKTTYRIKAYNLAGDQFVFSASLDVLRDVTPQPPASLTGQVLSSSKISLQWAASTTLARSYNLKRSLNQTGPFDVILGRTNSLAYQDEGLSPATTYYYVVTSLNSAGESVNSTVLQLTTNPLVAPTGVYSPRVASGDSRITLTWNFVHDVVYEIQRSQLQSGPYQVIASNVDAVRYEDASVQNNQTYYYKIVAYNSIGRSPESVVLTGTPVQGHYLHIGFNESSGTVAADDWGGYNGTLINGVTWSAGKDSLSGGATVSKSLQSYIQLPQGVVSTLNDFTIAAWLKLPADLGNNTRIFDFGSGTGTFMILAPKSGTNIRYKITSPSGTYDRYIPYILPTGQWVHVTLTQQGTDFKLYVDGQLIYSDNQATVKPSDMGSTTQNYLGKSQWPNDPYSDHIYDDLRIYNYAFTGQEVSVLADAANTTARLATDKNSTIRNLNPYMLYPNPTASDVSIEVPNANTTQVSLQVFTVLGQKVIEQKNSQVQAGRIHIDLSKLPAGTYRILVTDQTSSYTIPVVKY
ncbi:glycosyl hydrolase [Cytophagaceae bacterium DM2B3-1]|uniref:Glycosyl hydrolase n=1 Tax=Xanthocytophaga flava TaxID=3048013 RepID=A0ABT7CSH6_9BACT|nr:glycosyl hydrolase [Xanthocytophaga flavus]MDJ1496631.1 glycosyl hydrolase [Xanthocytophaga flavus]